MSNLNSRVAISRPSNSLPTFAEGQELSDVAKDVLALWGRYACPQLVGVTSIRNGEVYASIPENMFHGLNSAPFLIKLCFPSMSVDNIPMVKIGFSYLLTNGQAVIIQKDDQRTGGNWLNINSNPIPLSQLFDNGYIEESCHKRVFAWFQESVLSGNTLKANIKLTPKSDVSFTMRATQSDKGSNIAIWQIGFQSASLLSNSNSNLLVTKSTKAARSMASMMAEYSTTSVSQAIIPTMVSTMVSTTVPTIAPVSAPMDEME